MMLTMSVAASATGQEIQKPVRPKTFGRMSRASPKKTRHLKIDTVTEMTPFESAVKSADANMLKPTRSVPARKSR